MALEDGLKYDFIDERSYEMSELGLCNPVPCFDGKPWKIWMHDNNSNVDWMGHTCRLAFDNKTVFSIELRSKSPRCRFHTTSANSFCPNYLFRSVSFWFAIMRRFSNVLNIEQASYHV